jgi:hypothetical protein
MVGAMTIHGIIPGPQIMTKQPQLFWGMIASMWIGNLMLLVINLPLIGLWVRFLKVPYRLMFPSIVVLCCIGIYSVNNSPVDVVMTAGFGLFGYALVKFGFEPAPLLLGFVLGKLMEEKLRQALVISRGTFMTFIDRPLSGGLLAVALVLVVIAILPTIRRAATRCSRTPSDGRLRRGTRRARVAEAVGGISGPRKTSPSRLCARSSGTLPRGIATFASRCPGGRRGGGCARLAHFLSMRSRGIPAGPIRR